MHNAMPLFESPELASVRAECDALLKKLQRGGVDARIRIGRENRLKALRVKQMQLEVRLDNGDMK